MNSQRLLQALDLLGKGITNLTKGEMVAVFNIP
jgi:hypothetical protein